jgi:hypothetical protein
MAFLLLMDAPKSQSCWKDPNNAAHPLGLCVQLTMPQEPADIIGYHLFLDIKVDQTISFMTQATIVEIAVEREECWSVHLVQQRYYFVVFHALPAKVLANLPEGDTPAPQQGSLALGNVFIQDGSCRQGLLGVLVGMILKSALGKFYRFGNRVRCNAAPPLGRNRIPRHSPGDLFQHLSYHDPCTQESRLAMTDFWINDHVAPQEFSSHFCHVSITSLVV